jgi:outer membrane protein TolC
MKSNKKIPLHFLLAIGCMLIAGMGKAQTVMSLKDAVQYSLRGNTDIKKQNLAILQSKQKVQETIGQALPQINGTAQLIDNIVLPKTVLPGDFLGQPGTNIAVAFGVHYSIPLSVRADLNLYNQALIVGIQQAKASVVLSEANSEKTKQDVAYSVASAYYQAVILRQQGILISTNLDKVQQSLKVVQSQFENQMARKIDVDQLRVTQANTKTDFENTQIQFAYALDNLKILMGYAITDTLILNENITAESFSLPQNSISQNPKVALLNNQIVLKQLEIKGVNAKYLPSLAAFGSVGYQTQFNEWKSDQMNWFPNSLIGVQLNLPIFDGLQKYRQVKQRKFELQSIQLDQTLLSNSLNVQYNNATRKYAQNQKNVNNQQGNLNLAQSVYEAMQNNYKNGLASLSDLINSDTGLKNAQTQYLTSLLQLKISSLDILYANGTMNQLSN